MSSISNSNLKDSDNGVGHSESLGLWALSIVRIFKQLEKTTFQKLEVPHPHFAPLKTHTDPVSETLRFLFIQNSVRWTQPINPVIIKE
jgi:hypothetical protein